MHTYQVKKVKEKEVPWHQINALDIKCYPWYQSGLKQATYVKMVIHQNCIKIQAYCEDIHSYSRETTLNGDVYLDSCFEFFVTPENHVGGAYFNVEVNCCGVLHMSYKDGLGKTVYISEAQAKGIRITPSIKTPTKDERTDDTSWEIGLEIPIDILEDMCGKRIEQTCWYGNFYRCGGKTDDQYATWNPIVWEKPNFHLPKQFGKLQIV
ncbi:carbohydrate-binding family 9-like protein [Vallitalea pronyensis]|uniref:Carbohydrate-binding family 9-like protein n=1 Tax=Vallitalea pronyensis TaxID=1348613 RepID=A0A8J8SIC4_9FIRM|nr:carbohydrate-binding family 9-like protein [Vallitalea pronyensis]QUI24446.1 carbohydrate-binding family 9-like protein [Vallitalea pronyensis]